jgi:predicted phage terminase large subunit-like protein
MRSIPTSLPSYLKPQAFQYRLNKARLASGQKTVSFRTFKENLYPHYLHADHLGVIDNALMDAMRYVETQGAEGHGFWIFELPPRHGKTVSISRLFPPYALGLHPEWRCIMASYGATLAYKNSRAARNFMMSPRYAEIFPDVKLAGDSKAADAWDIAHHLGGLDAMGVGGGVTGKGGHIIVVDDPVKSRQEAESEVYRDKVWDWFTDDLYTRREPGGVIIVVMTRWHQDDLVGRLLKNEPDKWKRIRLPALAEDNDPLGRKVGEALWPERFPEPVLRDIECTMGAYSWSALYQQNPVPAEGGIFKRAWFNPLVANPPEIVTAYRSWDLAMSEKTSADYTAGVKIGQGTDGHWYILDIAHARVDWGDLTGFLADVILKDGPSVQQGIEEKGYMSRAISDLNGDPRLRGYAIFGYPVDTDKVTRALPFAAKCGAGLVHVVNAHWTEAYLDELCSFPMGAHDDQVDASSGAWAMTALGDAMATVADNGYMPMAGSY